MLQSVPAEQLTQIPVAPTHLHHPHIFHVILWVCFIVGLAVNVFARAAMVSWSKNNPVATVRQYLEQQWGPVSVRAFLLAVVFGLWNIHPAGAAQVLEFLADKLSWGGAKGMLSEFGLPLNAPVAAMFGYVGDSVLDKVLTRFPWIGQLLHIPGTQPPQQAPPDPDQKP